VRKTSTSRAWGKGIVLVVVSGLLAACATVNGPLPDAEPGSIALDTEGIDLEQYSSVTAQLDFEAGTAILPLNAISKSSPEIEALRIEAKRVLTDACLRKSGLPDVDWTSQVDAVEEDRLYGGWSVSIATRYGLEVPDSVASSTVAEYSSDELRCLGSAKDEMEDLLKQIDSVGLDWQVYLSSYDAVRASSEGKAAMAAAQACMTERGLKIDAESGFPEFDASSAGDSEINVRIAAAQATCNVETGAIQTLFDLTARYQAALIDRNEAAAVALSEEKAELMEAFRGIIEADQ